jgi:hypothetical protein
MGLLGCFDDLLRLIAALADTQDGGAFDGYLWGQQTTSRSENTGALRFCSSASYQLLAGFADVSSASLGGGILS